MHDRARRRDMRKALQFALLVLLVGALALVLTSQPVRAKMRIIGSYPIPDGGTGAAPIDLPGTRVALRTFGIAPNYYEFDCSSLQFVNPQRFNSPASDNDAICWICWAGSGANLGLDFGDVKHGGIGSRTTGQVLYEFPLDGEIAYMYGGMADGTEVMVVISEFHGKSRFLNLSQPGYLGTVSWPTGYETPDAWMMNLEDDCINWHGLTSYCYNSLSQTLFVPVSHLGLVYWCQIDLSGGFGYSTGTFSCGTDPQYIIQSTDGSAVYVFDDVTNRVYTVDPLSRQITATARFESQSTLGKTIYHQGHLYFPLHGFPRSAFTHKVARLDPVTGSVVYTTLNGRLIMDLDAHGGSVYALQPDLEDNCHLLELRTSDLQILDDIIVGDDNTISMQVDAPSGRLVVYDDTNESLVMVQL